MAISNEDVKGVRNTQETKVSNCFKFYNYGRRRDELEFFLLKSITLMVVSLLHMTAFPGNDVVMSCFFVFSHTSVILAVPREDMGWIEIAIKGFEQSEPLSNFLEQ